MVSNYEVDVFLNGLKDEDSETKNLVLNFLKVLEDANNPDLNSARKKLRDLMKRDSQIGKNKKVWLLIAPQIEKDPVIKKDTGEKKSEVENLGLYAP